MTLSLSLCGAESVTLLLASGTDPSSRAGMHQIPYLSSSHYQPCIWTPKSAFKGWCVIGDGLARMRYGMKSVGCREVRKNSHTHQELGQEPGKSHPSAFTGYCSCGGVRREPACSLTRLDRRAIAPGPFG